MTEATPLVLAVAPNGARHSKKDHPNLPITPSELADTAMECLEAGARMIHLHVRDNNGKHSLAPEHYRTAIKAVKDAVGDNMLIQVTSESAGVYSNNQQIDLMNHLKPDFMSLALREFIKSDSSIPQLREFLHRLIGEGCLLQYILYDQSDFNLYQRLSESGDIPDINHSLLFVLGRYTKQAPSIDIVEQYKALLSGEAPLMVCTFGPDSHQILLKTIDLGCHVRVGFENSFTLPDGALAISNAEMVKTSAQQFTQSGRYLATIEETRRLLGETL